MNNSIKIQLKKRPEKFGRPAPLCGCGAPPPGLAFRSGVDALCATRCRIHPWPSSFHSVGHPLSGLAQNTFPIDPMLLFAIMPVMEKNKKLKY
jgi:hypothetical protein